MENLSSSAFAPGTSQYAAAPKTSYQDPSSAENSHLADGSVAGDGNYVPRPKRIACVVCRRRKLRCDGKRPSCGTCSRLGHDCSYDEVRKKSGPKRGYVKQLEARLAQVETLLKGQEAEPAPRTSPPQPHETSFNAPINEESILDLPDITDLGNDINVPIPPVTNGLGQSQPSQMLFTGPTGAPNDPSWDLISLGLEEPLPTQDVIDELDNIFFEKIYPMSPIIHRPRYYASLKLAPHMRPPICLRYIMWCHAASVSDKYYFLHHHFYQRARKYAEMDEMKGFGENVISLAHCQMWILTGSYEFRMIYFPRAWLSVGKATRLALMMGLNRLDGHGIDVKQSILPPKDWTEREERRRTFWMAFCTDRYASIGTGWPMAIDENDIMTNLPASEESFLKSKPQRTLQVSDIFAGEGVSTLSPFACVCVLANLFGRNLVHIHRRHPQDNDHDLNGDFWKRHRSLDNILLHIALSLPEHLRMPGGGDDVNVIFANMSIHTSTICLHQAAIFKAEKNKMPSQIITESKRRCLVAANQISSIMKMISHMELTILNPFMSFCLYISARVFVQYLKSRPDDSTVYSSLQFVVSALNAMKSKNPLTESFLVQLDVDLEGTGIRAMDSSKAGAGLSRGAKAMQSYCSDNVDCIPMYNVRESQASGGQNEPSQDGSKSTTSARSFLPGMTTSLPSRHRGSPITDSERGPLGGESQQFFPHHMPTTNGIVEIAGQGVVDGDMDFSPDFGLGERNPPPSDHPTPSTLNSSSNTSYSMSGIDNTSPAKNQPNTTSTYRSSSSAASVDKSQSVQISPVITESSQAFDLNSVASQVFPANSAGPMGTTGGANVFNMANRWDMPTPGQDLSNIDFDNVNVEAFSDAQWAQILNTENGPGWESWRPS